MTVTRQGGMTLRKPDEPLVLLWTTAPVGPRSIAAWHPILQHAGHIAPAGTLDDAAFQRALQTIVDRHEVLRTTFTLEAGEPIQVIVPDSHSSYR